ncbi:nitroreductase family deazaflavin-dependent oxidoreductase [Mycolicibacterium fortuitum]|uniref:Nitroreductase family deazaflavin-dependent oxidoreductase n=3 Tax=Mycolicibacterium TaxID=1866885 RepID=A0AAE5AFI2_MYCFO|nr:nitroreductase family deazaflavin-dependent oxidoreductase [Mycolicibacterium fortuitum]MDV7194404.1 nitroreductase family deazaflavin-dependent oxidoreductase [Mycolicibacterium fortuitum]MDV7207981.1 nitroreductase family deazaflavin-dependent oxidoreductase [Mycolicibacterium fortuitum]MDV7229924.1 nitroreductase family deazaflavin-dependent oxidoreductase [Mycolicibacterium fortuitum]MDV7261679.1 nitroreductase family deazaflavin-dependent oxidoreductase [Mycolicibacterium fortuitum]MDV
MKLPWYIKPGNKAIVALSRLGLRFGAKGPVILTVTGRKSGKPRATPVTPMFVDGKQYVAAAPEAAWIANVRADQAATLSRGRRVERVRAIELSDADARPLLRLLPNMVPGWVGFLRQGGLVTDGDPDEFEALLGRMPIFRMDPA